jgi:hypothetical protein
MSTKRIHTSKLEVVFTLGLAYPIFTMGTPSSPLEIDFAETNNKVRIDPPTEEKIPGPMSGELSKLVLHVERESTEDEANQAMVGRITELKISQDATRALFLCFETLREIEYRNNNTVHGYPVVQTESLQSNPLVWKCEYEVCWNGRKSLPITQTSRAAILIQEDSWMETVERLKKKHSVPVYTSFVLDAFYFAQADPLRSIIMACAAWETAMRQYLANVASAIDPAYKVASKGGNIPNLSKYVRAAKRGDLFHTWLIPTLPQTNREVLLSHRKLILKLPELRNKILHEGATGIQGETARLSAHAVLTRPYQRFLFPIC